MAQTNPGPIQQKPTDATQTAQTPAQQINQAMKQQSQAQPNQQLQTGARNVLNTAVDRINQAMKQQPSAQTQANAQTTQEALGNVYRVGANGQGPKGMKVGDQVVTEGGTWTVTGVNPDGSYQSKLTNRDQTTYNYKGQYAPNPTVPGQQATTQQVTPTGKIYRVGDKSQGPKGMQVGDQVVTEGGTWMVTGVNADGSYQSQLVDRNQTTCNYKGKYDTMPSASTAAAKQPEVPSYAKPYQDNVDYAAEIQKAVAAGDLGAAAYFEQARNAKIDAEGLGDKYAKTNLYSQYLSQLTPERQAMLMNGYVAQSSYPENPRDRWMQWAEYWAKNQKGLVDTQIDYATNQGILEAQRAEEDAQPKFQQQLNQNDIDTARAMSNSALYAEMRGDRGGIGQSQYNEVQAAGLRAKQEINSARTKLATDTARAIADLRSKGEFQKAESYMKIQNELMAKYFEIENAILNYGISRAEYEQAKEQADFNRDYQIANLLGTYNGQPTQSSQRYNQEQLIANAQWKLATGIMPTAEELAALGITATKAVCSGLLLRPLLAIVAAVIVVVVISRLRSIALVSMLTFHFLLIRQKRLNLLAWQSQSMGKQILAAL